MLLQFTFYRYHRIISSVIRIKMKKNGRSSKEPFEESHILFLFDDIRLIKINLPVSLADTWITRNNAKIAAISSHLVPRGINAVIVKPAARKKKFNLRQSFFSGISENWKEKRMYLSTFKNYGRKYKSDQKLKGISHESWCCQESFFLIICQKILSCKKKNHEQTVRFTTRNRS